MICNWKYMALQGAGSLGVYCMRGTSAVLSNGYVSTLSRALSLSLQCYLCYQFLKAGWEKVSSQWWSVSCVAKVLFPLGSSYRWQWLGWNLSWVCPAWLIQWGHLLLWAGKVPREGEDTFWSGRAGQNPAMDAGWLKSLLGQHLNLHWAKKKPGKQQEGQFSAGLVSIGIFFMSCALMADAMH